MNKQLYSVNQKMMHPQRDRISLKSPGGDIPHFYKYADEEEKR